jgi:hypothetical protein
MPSYNSLALLLHNAVAAVAPIEHVSLGQFTDKSTWVVNYADGVTPQQIQAAQNVVNSFVIVPDPDVSQFEDLIWADTTLDTDTKFAVVDLIPRLTRPIAKLDFTTIANAWAYIKSDSTKYPWLTAPVAAIVEGYLRQTYILR